MTTIFRKKNLSGKASFLPRIAQTDKTAAQECIDVYGAMIWALAKQFTDSDGVAELAVQKIFVDIWENAAFCDLTLSDERVWIAMIARRRLARMFAENDSQAANFGRAAVVNRNAEVAA